MATGEHGHGTLVVPDWEDLPTGAVVTSSGRVSVAEVFRQPSRADHPFTPGQMTRLDEALTLASRETGLLFSVYLGDLGEKPHERISELHGELTDAAVLVAVSPEQRVVEVVTGPEARFRLPDRGAELAVLNMVASFKKGDLLGGLLSGLRMIADQVCGRSSEH
ncbi:MAG: DUF5130 family protein [Pseudonocardia sp.]